MYNGRVLNAYFPKIVCGTKSFALSSNVINSVIITTHINPKTHLLTNYEIKQPNKTRKLSCETGCAVQALPFFRV